MTADRSVMICGFRPIHGICPVLTIVLLLTGSGLLLRAAEPPSSGSPADRAPYFDRRSLPLTHAGPGRDRIAPEGLSEVRIGYFGPDDPDHPDAGDLWCAAQLAIEDANADGGFEGKPFRLVARWSADPWTGGATKVTQLVYEDQVWAIVGGVDGPSTHVAVQVATKAWLPILCASTTDRTSNSAIVPWMFSLLPGDQLLAPLLVAKLADQVDLRPFVVIAGQDHDSRCFLRELERSFRQDDVMPAFQFVDDAREATTREIVRRTTESHPAAVMVIADPAGSLRIIRALRAAGYAGQLLGGPSVGRRRFLREAASDTADILFPLLVHEGPQTARFVEQFQNRFQRSPDFAAASTYDATQLLVAAIRRAGLNRVRIADAVREMSPWDGVAGMVRWDPLGGNTRPARLGSGTIEQGRMRQVVTSD